MRRPLLVVAALTAVMFASSRCHAALRTFARTEGALSAEAAFETDGSNLKVTLSNISPADVMHNPEILTAVFFDVSSKPTLGKGSAKLASGSDVLFSTRTPHPKSVGGEWAFKSGLGSFHLPEYGISAVGFGVFGPGDRFDTSSSANLHGPSSPGGIDYGLTSKGDDPTTGTGHVGGKEAWPLIQSSAVFTLTGLPGDFDLEEIGNVRFQYGSSLDEEHFTGLVTPAPGTLALVGAGIVPLAARLRRRRASRTTEP